MSNTPVVEALKHVLAESYALYLKTQNYHWNVTGPQFKSLHELFEEQYTDLAAAIDEIAERIRALGQKAPGGFAAYQSLASIKDGDENAAAEQMVAELKADNQAIVAVLKTALEKADQQGDEATVDAMVQRIATHEKAAWMLAALLGEEVSEGASNKSAA